MSKIFKPIPTKYKGILYKSRLEARWAVFFDVLGINVNYEPLTIENNNLQWTPDFIPQRGSIRVSSDKFIYDKVRDMKAIYDFFENNNSHKIPLLIEIKPRKPNLSYIEYLENFAKSGKYNILICADYPNLLQLNGILITSKETKHGINFYHCQDCKTIDLVGIRSPLTKFESERDDDFGKFQRKYFNDLIDVNLQMMTIDNSHYCPAVQGNHEEAIEKAKYYRFDLEDED